MSLRLLRSSVYKKHIKKKIKKNIKNKKKVERGLLRERTVDVCSAVGDQYHQHSFALY